MVGGVSRCTSIYSVSAYFRFWNPDDLLTNIQDGALYIGDKAFGKLPDVYTEHPTYRRLFGERVSHFIVQIRVGVLM